MADLRIPDAALHDRGVRVALTALGCKVNYAEMAELAGALAAAGCTVVDEAEPADVRVVNSCTVTLQADATTRQRLTRLRRQYPHCHLIVTGCSVDTNPDRYLPNDSVGARSTPRGIDAAFSNAEKSRIVEHVVALCQERDTLPPLAADLNAVPPLRARAFIKVQDGCNHRCSYCIVWRARGQSRSVTLNAVLEQAERALTAGHAELVIAGVDLGSWGRDIGLGLATLVEALLDAVGDRGRIRLSSINANDVSDSLIELSRHPRLCPHWHMPLQSGSDEVLKAMYRGYRRAQFARVAAALRQSNPDAQFTTDIMVGFPGETEADHKATLELVREIGFLRCHIFRYSPRPDTAAAALAGRIDDATAHRRSQEVHIAAAKASTAAYASVADRRLEVVWDRIDATWAHGFAATYHEVGAPAQPDLHLGGISQVLVQSVDGNVLRAVKV